MLDIKADSCYNLGFISMKHIRTAPCPFCFPETGSCEDNGIRTHKFAEDRCPEHLEVIKEGHTSYKLGVIEMSYLPELDRGALLLQFLICLI